MGFGIKELVVILVIVLLLFGTKKLKGIGTDLGSAIKGFKKSMSDDDKDKAETDAEAQPVEDNRSDASASKMNSEQKDKSV
ncbi:MAG: twin-arginine translocase subunit TatA [Spongiibacteraceae bacterium]|jgi:sec-independent protein translocase protein TatA|nr:twin-arginine translocase subunit TatA [Spongiibacteraceae bacterium]|tara:strand:+ start:454 stop:696 length:243 start_codon:yes stop_codon:yes gene_type:complete